MGEASGACTMSYSHNNNQNNNKYRPHHHKNKYHHHDVEQLEQQEIEVEHSNEIKSQSQSQSQTTSPCTKMIQDNNININSNSNNNNSNNSLLSLTSATALFIGKSTPLSSNSSNQSIGSSSTNPSPGTNSGGAITNDDGVTPQRIMKRTSSTGTCTVGNNAKSTTAATNTGGGRSCQCVCTWKFCHVYYDAFRKAQHPLFGTDCIKIKIIKDHKESMAYKLCVDRTLQVQNEPTWKKSTQMEGVTYCTYTIARHHFTEQHILKYNNSIKAAVTTQKNTDIVRTETILPPSPTASLSSSPCYYSFVKPFSLHGAKKYLYKVSVDEIYAVGPSGDPNDALYFQCPNVPSDVVKMEYYRTLEEMNCPTIVLMDIIKTPTKTQLPQFNKIKSQSQSQSQSQLISKSKLKSQSPPNTNTNTNTSTTTNTNTITTTTTSPMRVSAASPSIISSPSDPTNRNMLPSRSRTYSNENNMMNVLLYEDPTTGTTENQVQGRIVARGTNCTSTTTTTTTTVQVGYEYDDNKGKNDEQNCIAESSTSTSFKTNKQQQGAVTAATATATTEQRMNESMFSERDRCRNKDNNDKKKKKIKKKKDDCDGTTSSVAIPTALAAAVTSTVKNQQQHQQHQQQEVPKQLQLALVVQSKETENQILKEQLDAMKNQLSFLHDMVAKLQIHHSSSSTSVCSRNSNSNSASRQRTRLSKKKSSGSSSSNSNHLGQQQIQHLRKEKSNKNQSSSKHRTVSCTSEGGESSSSLQNFMPTTTEMIFIGTCNSCNRHSATWSIPEEINFDDDNTESRETYVSQLTKGGDFGDGVSYTSGGGIDDDNKTILTNRTFQSNYNLLPSSTTTDVEGGVGIRNVHHRRGNDDEDTIEDDLDSMSGTSTILSASRSMKSLLRETELDDNGNFDESFMLDDASSVKGNTHDENNNSSTLTSCDQSFGTYNSNQILRAPIVGQPSFSTNTAGRTSRKSILHGGNGTNSSIPNRSIPSKDNISLGSKSHQNNVTNIRSNSMTASTASSTVDENSIGAPRATTSGGNGTVYETPIVNKSLRRRVSITDASTNTGQSRAVDVPSPGDSSSITSSSSRSRFSPGGTTTSSTYGVVGIEVTDPHGEKGTYTGSISKATGMPHGHGRLEYDKAGRWYEGEWKHGRWTGQGILANGDGDYYKGSLKNDQKHGYGIMEFSDGRRFEGRYNCGQMSQGKMTYRDSSMYDGTWENGVRHGVGRCFFADGSTYNGEFKEGEFHGLGKMTWNDGGYYEGQWTHGQMHGKGREVRPDGTVRHDGEWVNSQPIRKKKRTPTNK